MKKLLSFYQSNGPERVGYITKTGEVVEVQNIHPEPQNGFSLSEASLVLLDKEAVATWHTHPNGGSYLSSKDYLAFLNYPELKHYIVGSDSIRCYAVEDRVVVELENTPLSRISEGPVS